MRPHISYDKRHIKISNQGRKGLTICRTRKDDLSARHVVYNTIVHARMRAHRVVMRKKLIILSFPAIISRVVSIPRGCFPKYSVSRGKDTSCMKSLPMVLIKLLVRNFKTRRKLACSHPPETTTQHVTHVRILSK